MSSSAPAPDALDALVGAEIASEVAPNVAYHVLSRVGEGATAAAFHALRVAPEGDCAVVVKVLKPWVVRQSGMTAQLIVQKEAVALGRLNERVPPTPFVVRFIDAGTCPVRDEAEMLDLPWIALEYVHGGVLGTTLADRVAASIRDTGRAFDAHRAAHAVECLAAGLAAVHEVRVVHRDLKPSNVLCCGQGDDEIFKLADFGVARPAGMPGTFGGVVVGTLGYAAPEIETADQRAIGPWSDVFSLAAVVYFLLTGERYFDVRSSSDAIVVACGAARRSLRDAPGLAPEIAAHDQAVRGIDYALAFGTQASLDERPHRPEALAALIVPWLREAARASRRATSRALALVADAPESGATRVDRWRWTTLQRPSGARIVRHVAWDGDGKCLAATTTGLSFWNGTSWCDVSVEGLPSPAGVRFVRRAAPGRWLLGGDEATVATFTADGIADVRQLPGKASRFDMLSGAIDDLAVLVEKPPGEPPLLRTLSARRWIKAYPLRDVATLASIARIDDARWLLAGRAASGAAYAALFSPLHHEVERLPAPDARALVACAARHEIGVGLAVGTGGAVVWLEDDTVAHEWIEGGHDLAAAAVDAAGGGWVAAAGRIWARVGPASVRGGLQPTSRWECIWHDRSWTTPIVSLFADGAAVIAMTADGGIVEGRRDVR